MDVSLEAGGRLEERPPELENEHPPSHRSRPSVLSHSYSPWGAREAHSCVTGEGRHSFTEKPMGLVTRLSMISNTSDRKCYKIKNVNQHRL